MLTCQRHVMKYLADKNVSKVGSIGFCWGAWANTKASAAGMNIGAIVGPHPSVKLEEFAFKRSQAELLGAVKCPVMLMLAGNDDERLKDGNELGSIVMAREGSSVVEFPEMSHGWMSRGDIKDESVARDVKLAMEKTLDFFKLHL